MQGWQRFPIRRREEGRGRTLGHSLDDERGGNLRMQTRSARNRHGRGRHRQSLDRFLSTNGLCRPRHRILTECNASRWPLGEVVTKRREWMSKNGASRAEGSLADLTQAGHHTRASESCPRPSLPRQLGTSPVMAQSNHPAQLFHGIVSRMTTNPSLMLFMYHQPSGWIPSTATCHLARFR